MDRPERARIAAWLMIALGCVLGAALLAKRFVRVSRYSQLITATIEKRLHRRVAFSSASVTLWPRPGLRLADLEISGNPPQPGHPFLAMKSLRVQVALRPLLERRLVIEQVVLESPVMVAARDRKGRLSFADVLDALETPASSSRSPSSAAPSILVAKTVVRDGDLTFIDDSSPQGRSVTRTTGIDLEVERVGYAEPPRLEIRSRSEAYGGRWEITGTTTLHDVPTFEFAMIGRGVRVERLTAAEGRAQGSMGRRSKHGMTGLVDMQARLRREGRDARAWKEALTGTGRMTLRNGSIPSSNILESVIRSLLGLFGRIVPVRDDVSLSEPTTIDRFDQPFEVGGGRVRMDSIHLVTSDYVLTGRGSAGLDRTLDFDTLVRLTPKGTQKMVAASSVGALDDSLGTLKPIPVRITGTAGNPVIRPRVAVLPAKGLPNWIPGARIKRGMEAGAGAIRSGLGRLF